MGVSYNVILAVGKEFEDKSEVLDFIEKNNGKFSDDVLDEIEADGIGEFLYSNEICGGITCESLDYYSGWQGCVLGYRLSVWPSDKFAEAVTEAQQKFKDNFGIDGDVICTVQVA